MKVDLKWAWRSIYFENCFSVNPRTYTSTGLNAIFFVNGEGEMYPNPITEGRYQNVTAMPEGEPLDQYEKIIGILSKYTDEPEKAYYEGFVKPFQF